MFFYKKKKRKKPLISIITVVYNGEKYIEQTIQSVINQSFKDFEYIVIDGKSNDSTLNIIKKYRSKIDIIISQKDKESTVLNISILSEDQLKGVTFLNQLTYNYIQKEIEEKGVVISEVPIGTPPQAQQFPRRNRMISGLSHGVIVLEAAMRSGSLITARFALEQGRDVFAVPGSPSDGRCEGSNDLIRQGGNVLTSVEDIINMYPDEKESPTSIKEMQKPSYPPPPALSSRERSKAHQMLLGNMSSSPIGVDELTRACHLSASEVSASLLELELAGRVTRPSGSHVSRLN